jgi:hypothetical protein
VEAALNQTSTPTWTKIEMGLPPEGGEEVEERDRRHRTEEKWLILKQGKRIRE